MESNSKSNEVLENDITNIKDDIKEIKKKLDEKYVSHESFNLAVNAINVSTALVVKVGLFLITPIYIAVVTLVFKTFTQ